MQTTTPPRRTSSLRHRVAKGSQWTFDDSVASCYDDMLERSIPDYHMMRKAMSELAIRYLQPGTTMLDLGCSIGGATSAVLSCEVSDIHTICVDNSPSMLSEARNQLESYIASGAVEIVQMDLREQFPTAHASVTLAILTLQFIPVEYRKALLRRIYEHTLPGGALIIVEKILGETAGIDGHMVDAYHTLKAANGYSDHQIAEKRKALQGVQVPLTARMNEDLLRQAGFTQIDSFWRWMNFAGWIAVRPIESVPIRSQAIRGATIVEDNTPDALHDATRELLKDIMRLNHLDKADIVSAFFTVTPDLNSAFPAKAARQLGWNHVSLLCAQEIPVPGAMPMCMRVLLHINTRRPSSMFRSVYIHGADRLLKDDCEPAD